MLPRMLENVGFMLPRMLENVGFVLPRMLENVGFTLPRMLENVGFTLPRMLENVGFTLPRMLENVGFVLPRMLENVGFMLPRMLENVGFMLPQMLEKCKNCDMKRKIYTKIKEWKQHWNGRTALLIDGARRIGKSWIVEEFARNEYRSYILIDFNNVKEGILELFNDYLTDLDTFFMRLSLFMEVELYPRESVIIFDEVQMFPKARAAIKYLVKDGRYDYIETGSLVSINHNVKDIVIPSEEVRLNMYPMDLEEFCWAMGQEVLYDYVLSQFE